MFIDEDSDIETDEASFNMSLDSSTLETSVSTRSTSGYVSRVEEENASLKAENAKIKAELEETRLELARFKDFFKVTKKPTRANGSGGCQEFGTDLTIVALEGMSEAAEAKTVHRVLESLARQMNLVSPDDDSRRVPRPDWFVKNRSKLDGLLQSQRLDFLAGGGPYYISFDATNLHSDNVISMVVFNKDLEYLNFGYKNVEAKTGHQIAATMLALLREHDGLEQDLECLITDKCPAQQLGNRYLMDLINQNRCQDKQVYSVPCLMHTCLGGDNRSSKQLSSDTQKLAKDIQISFGGRRSDGWRKDSLKKSLEAKLGITSEFETTIGSRFRVGMANGSALWRHEDEVYQALTDSARTRHITMVEVMDGPEWPRIRLELAIPVLVWTSIIGPFHTVISGRATYGGVKSEFELAFRKIGKIRQSNCIFGEALSIAKDQVHGPNSTTPEAIRLIEGSWRRGTNRNLRRVVNEVASRAFDQVFQKLTADWISMRDLPIPDEKAVEWTNRRVESAFAYLKSIDKKFSTMITDNVQMTALAKMNHISSWLQSNRHRVSTASARADYYELRRKRETSFTLEMAVEEFLSAE